MSSHNLLLQLPVSTASPNSSDSINQFAGEETLKNIESFASSDTIEKIVESLINFGFKLGIAILVFFAGKFIINWLYRWTSKLMTKKGAEPSLTSFILSLIKITLYFILIITVIGIIGIETSSFLALFASAGVAVGLALSGTLQNFAGGVLILLLKPYKVGDFIEAQGYSGTVKEIQIFNTIINTPDNKAIIIPNGGLSTSSINNYSLERRRRVDWTLGVAYGTDFDLIRSIILGMLAEEEMLEQDPKPAVYLNELADSSINISIRAWVASSDYWTMYFKMNERFYKELPNKGIEFPFPQMDVHISNVDGQQ